MLTFKTNVSTFMKNKMWLLVSYTENEPSVEYAQRWGEK
jgi:hypothetical protein